MSGNVNANVMCINKGKNHQNCFFKCKDYTVKYKYCYIKLRITQDLDKF